MPGELCVTTDIPDNLLDAERRFEQRDLDALMAYAASLGATRHQWVFDSLWALYDAENAADFDLLEVACDAAHRHGMRFDVMFKPFEGALANPMTVLPESFPRPDGVPVLESPEGLLHAVRPFVAEHPEMRMARRPDADLDPGGRIGAIRLVKSDDAPVPFSADEISLWTSPRNGGFRPYRGPMSLSEAVEWRPAFPCSDQEHRIVTIGDLELPDDTRFILIQRDGEGDAGDFANALDSFVELVGENGELIPSTPSLGRVDPEALHEQVALYARLGLTRYLREPAARELIADGQRFIEASEGMFAFFSIFQDRWWQEVTLGPGDELAVARGKPRHIQGALHPIYPEVREHWLDEIRFCIERGVDGVNIRLANHNRSFEPWAYGFNPPVPARMRHPDSIAEARRINGQAYTRFLREAADLLHDHGLEMGVQITPLVFAWDERHPGNSHLVPNVDWEWERWTRELADYVELRGTKLMRRHNIREIVDRIGLVAREANIPFMIQSNRTGVHFAGPHPTTAEEMDWVRKHPDITGYNLYETARFTRINRAGRLEGSQAIRDVAREHWSG